MLNAADWTIRLNELATEANVPGAALGIWSDGQEILAAHGVLNAATQVPVTIDSVFQVGSITKTWTATMIMQLVDEGLLSLDTTVSEVLHGARLYPTDGRAFEFIYPPLSALLLAIPAWFGKVALYLCLCLMNVIAWWVTILYVNAMTGAGRTPGMWLFALPGFVTITFVFDMFDLGQPNLVLLALMLYGFWSMQQQRRSA